MEHMRPPHSVTAHEEPLTIPTYPVGQPETHPLFFEKRVYQGSCGKVYPVPFIDKVYDDPLNVTYRSVRLENEFVRVVLLPEIGGRIFKGQDKANADYDFFYRQDVIKPALVGLAGPWISGGVEFNWPQHHRPGTFLPADYWIEEEPDGARTVWMSEHDPINRLKGMHGIRLRPGSAVVELRGRLYNRTPLTHTFLWWANLAARVHDNYQSFFPEDVDYVADHAVRAMSSFPKACNHYYGVDYSARPGANDLSWYKNIPVPTSYMICQTAFDFFGGYDYEANGGFLHIADRHISPGKKQWTWGNHEFGWAWDRELTDENGPYVELMAGVYTDNQPDFTYLRPGEVKTFTQSWWPYQQLGPVQQADERLAIRLGVESDGSIQAGVAAAERLDHVWIRLSEGDRLIEEAQRSLQPGKPWQAARHRLKGGSKYALKLEVLDAQGKRLLAHRPVEPNGERLRELATEPPMPEAVEQADELYFVGEHLEQYRHPTRYPERYWEAALERDPGDGRSHLGLGKQFLQRGQFAKAERHLRASIQRQTSRHPNPESTEAHYLLGVLHRLQGRMDEAIARLMKATWDYAWRTPAHLELAAIALLDGDPAKALTQAEAALDTNRQCNRAQLLAVLALKQLGRADEADKRLQSLLAADPLDHWARWEAGDREVFRRLNRNDAQTVLDVAFDYAECGQFASAIELLEWHHREAVDEVAVPNPLERTPMTHYALAWLYQQSGDRKAAQGTLVAARSRLPDYFFPSRLPEQLVLEWTLDQGADGHAAYALGNYCYDRKRHEEAIALWERATDEAPGLATAQRNLGIAYWNVRSDAEAARAAYRKALELTPKVPRLVAEYSQLCAKLGDSDAERLAFLEANEASVRERDDACVQWATLLNATGQPQRALDLLENRRFHPWEGGEGKVLRQFTQACLLLGQAALEKEQAPVALDYFEKAMDTPENLGESYHLLQAKADVNYWRGRALRELEREAEAVACFEASANEAGDFQQMAVTAHSELSYFRGLSLRELGRVEDARVLFEDLRRFAEQQKQTPAKIDYFATSLPNLLVFEEDLDQAKDAHADQLLALAAQGLLA